MTSTQSQTWIVAQGKHLRFSNSEDGYGDGDDAGLEGDGDVDASSHAKEERWWRWRWFPPSPELQSSRICPPSERSEVPPPPRPRIISRILGRNFLGETKVLLKRPSQGGARGSTWWVPRGQVHGPCGPLCFGPRGSRLFGLLPTAFLPMKNWCGNFPFIIWVPVAPETIKTRKRRFPASQKLNTKNRNFVWKSPKSSKTCKANDITMQITS